MRDLSILIPSYNDECLTLVEQLKAQADSITGLKYEILVADDGSTNKDVLKANRNIASLKNCRFIERGENVGRAAIRNFLGKEAQYDWLIFIDCEVTPSANLVKTYAELKTRANIVCGGITIGGDKKQWKNNLRYRYEKSMESSYTAHERDKHGYHSFRTTNFMIERSVFLSVLFNEEVRTYGYEDVIFGKHMKGYGFRIKNIDNTVEVKNYETNERFVEKTEESLATLKAFSKEIDSYSPIIRLMDSMKKSPVMLGLAKFGFKHTKKMLRKNLCSNNPSLFYYKLYKIGYYMSLHSNSRAVKRSRKKED